MLWLGPDVPDDEDRQRITRLNRIFLIMAALLTGLRALSLLSAWPATAPLVAVGGLTIAILLALFWSQRLAHVRLTAYLTAAFLWAMINLAAFLAGGVDRPFFGTNITVLIFVALTLGARPLSLFTLATIVVAIAMYLGRLAGVVHVPATLSTDLLVAFTTLLFNVIAAGVYLGLAAQGLQAALDLARQLIRKIGHAS